MNSVKLGIVVVVALAVGALGGGVFARQQLGSQLTDTQQKNAQAAQELDKTRKQLAELTQIAAAAEKTLAARNTELEKVQAAFEQMAGDGGLSASMAEASAEEALGEDMPPPPPAPLRAPRDGVDPMEGVPRGPDGNPLPPETLTERPPSMRLDFSQRMNERMQEYYEAETAKTNDPAVQQRLATLRDQSTYMMDVMQRMRDSADPDERTQLQEEFQQVRSNVSNLVQEQQDHMLRQVAAQNGITDPQKQEAFMNSLRETQDSPFFRSPMMSWGGDRGRRGRDGF
ncbi:MAG: hypothetical protein RBU21_00680 [FCB group bacterium]|jgi:hypothetical protein|nr:hypothetical protein [FCB group bacterium]